MSIFDFFKRKKNEVVELPTSLERESKSKLFAWNVFPINTYIVDEQLTWFLSNSNILLEFYSASMLKSYPQNFLHFRNCENYFWVQSAREKKIKRTTAGIMYSVIKSIVDIVGVPKIGIFGEENIDNRLKVILDKNKFFDLYSNKQMPMVGVMGWGAYRIDIDTINEDCPRIRYYDGRNSRCKENADGIQSIITTDYFLYNGKEYVVLDERYMKDKNTSVVDTKVYEIRDNEEWVEAKLSDFPNLKNTNAHLEIKAPFILAEFVRWYELPDTGFNEGLYGRPLFYGKIDSLDDYDQAVSIASTTIRRSTPRVSYPVDSLETTKNGDSKIPDRFDLEYIQVPNQITGDGKTIENSGPKVVQPNVVIDIYTKEQDQILDQICSGIISVGDLAMNQNAYLYRDSGTALRERSKQTLFTRNVICKKEQEVIKSLMNKTLYCDSIFFGGVKLKETYDIEVLYDKFSIPSKEERVKVYLPMFQSGAISDEMFVSLIYDDDLSEEDKQNEIAKIQEKRLLQQGMTNNDSQKVPEIPRSTSPYEADDRLDKQSGMNNYNRGVKGALEI